MELWQGVSNANYYVSLRHNDDHHSSKLDPKMPSKLTRVGVIRVNNQNMNKITDRGFETKLLSIASEAGVTPRFLFRTENGHCTQYLESKHVPCYFLRKEFTLKLVVTVLGRFNRFTAESNICTPGIVR